jgi:antitoxin (DNA-binding transcriptional repressor) of toxin-antitoxin stability system
MRVVGLKTLTNKLSEYIRAAAAGETMLVTDPNRVLAEIVPASARWHSVLADAMLADALRHGWGHASGARGGPACRPASLSSGSAS